MKKEEKIFSESGRKVIEIVQDRDGSYILHKYLIKYDEEEEKLYEIRELPNPEGKYQSFSSAVKEAKRILKVNTY